MVWVIGDIHGMLDPLKRLIMEIRKREAFSDGNKPEKLIFIGDYIDYGPCSKEVLDFLLDLEYETVFLSGNHEDLLRQFYAQSDFFQKYGNIWFRGNGAQDTILSFTRSGDLYKEVNNNEPGYYPGEHLLPADYTFEKKYLDFFGNLSYLYQQEFKGETEIYKVVFVHAGLNASADLDLQLQLTNYRSFQNYLQETKTRIEDSIIWTRTKPTAKFRDYIVIHGHTPTCTLKHCYEELGNYQVESGLPYLLFTKAAARLEKAGHETYRVNYPLADLISINIDTGSVYGDYLTALQLDSQKLTTTHTLPVLQVKSGGNHRNREDVRQFTIQFKP